MSKLWIDDNCNGWLFAGVVIISIMGGVIIGGVFEIHTTLEKVLEALNEIHTFLRPPY